MPATEIENNEKSEPGPRPPSIIRQKLTATHHPSRPQMTIRRRGKIAQLPKPLRDEINRLIEENVSSTKIIALLAQRGYPGVTRRNLTSWIQGSAKGKGSSGYNDWCQEQQALEDLHARLEFALELTRQNSDHPDDIHDAARLLAASQLAEVVSDFDVQQLKQALSARPESYALVVNALTKLSRDNLEYERYRYKVAEEKRKIQAELTKTGDAGLSPETIQKIQQALNSF
jgi:hypothetical protein